ncbi:MAG: aldo/keto reductase, partial [Chloroflexi bacterium]|nr:aldo/keto reductase [Chloroflexota bacterium]
LAIAWTLAQPAMASCIVGAKTPEQVLHNASAADWRLSEPEMAELREILAPVDLGTTT